MFPANAVGLCAGRHDIPVEKYIFTDVHDVLDFSALNHTAELFVRENCDVRIEYGTGPAQVDGTDVACCKGNALDVVVTGLTTCTTAVMWACACYGIPLTLWHYDRENETYVPQRFCF